MFDLVWRYACIIRVYNIRACITDKCIIHICNMIKEHRYASYILASYIHHHRCIVDMSYILTGIIDVCSISICVVDICIINTCITYMYQRCMNHG